MDDEELKEYVIRLILLGGEIIKISVLAHAIV